MKTYSKEDAIKLKIEGLKQLDSLLEHYINSDTGHIKKAALLSTWIKQFSNYIFFEEKFNPLKNISYKRGDVVFANFGFNVGSEFGGGHYAVVLNNASTHHSSNITVVPLSSYKEGAKIHPKDVFIGDELFEKLSLKLKTLALDMRNQLELSNRFKNIGFEDLDEEKARDFVTVLNDRIWRMNKDLGTLELLNKEILSLKRGSIAKVEQIRTISKIRIYNPKNTHDPLYGIRLSAGAMQKINSKLKELFIFDE